MTFSALAAQNTFSVRSHNRRLLLLTLLDQQPISRVRLARLTGLSTTTVTNLTGDLLTEGVIEEVGVDLEAVTQGAGRPPVALELARDSRLAIGVHIGVRTVRIVLCNLLAAVVDGISFAIDSNRPASEIVEQIITTVLALASRAGLTNQSSELVGLGVGASGLVDCERGVNHFAPNLGWRDVPLRDMLQSGLGLRVVVDNNVRYMALGESMYGAGHAVRALAFIYARVGVAAGLVVDGKIYRGAGYGAGEIGHWIMAPAIPADESPVTLEHLLSERTLVRIAHELAPTVVPESHARDADAVAAVLAAARAGHPALQAMLAERARYLGIAMANLVDVLNPELLLLGGTWPMALICSSPLWPRPCANMRLPAWPIG